MGLFDRLRSSGPRVAFLGIDGVPYTLIEDHPDVFENLHAIAEEGVGGAIDSIVPPESSACWPALTTGTNPGKTGVYGFQDREEGSYDTYVPLGHHVRGTRLWDRAEDDGRDATVLNVPVTFPPQQDVQRMVAGFLSGDLDDGVAHPDDVYDYLDSIDYIVDADVSLGHEDTEAFIENAHATLDSRYEAFRRYVEEDDWDLFFGVFMTTDRVNHFLFNDYEDGGEHREEFLEFYRTVDRHVGELHDQLPDDVTTVVASDHGFAGLDYEVQFNEWLQEEGWLSYRTDDHEELGDIADDARAYSLIPGRFFVHLEGREPRGSVPNSEYESTRAELKSMIEDLEAPDGTPVADRVVEKEAVFEGPHDRIAPDLVAVPNEGFDFQAGFGGSEAVFGPSPREGWHTFENATLIADDPDLTIDDDVNLYDIAPTLLDLLEVGYDDAEMDGHSLVA